MRVVGVDHLTIVKKADISQNIQLFLQIDLYHYLPHTYGEPDLLVLKYSSTNFKKQSASRKSAEYAIKKITLLTGKLLK